MRIRLFLVISILLIATLFTSTPTQPTSAADNDCNVVGQVCRDMAEMMYNLCMADGGNASDCAWMEAGYTTTCIKNNGCAPSGN